MNLFPLSPLTLSLVLFSLQIHSLTFTGYEIRDLESNSTSFQQETSAWTLIGSPSLNNFTLCTGTWLLGGSEITTTNTIFMRVYAQLPVHNLLYFSVKLWVLDLSPSVPSNLFKMSIDGTEAHTWKSTFLKTFSSSNICGNSNPDYPSVTLTGNLNHSLPLITIQFQSLVSSSMANFGIRDLSLLFKNSSSIVLNSECLLTQPNSGLSSCLCPEGHFDSFLGCTTCDPACNSCFGGTSQQCFGCSSGFSWNGQKCFACHATCNSCSETAETQCLSCASGRYLYKNGTCQQSCDSPMLRKSIAGVETCESPCNATAEFLYWNGSCGVSCPEPWKQRTDSNGVKYCEIPCSNGTEFWYQNGTCLPNCEAPFISSMKENVLKYCERPCFEEEFLYWNRSCKSSCETPLVGNNATGQAVCSLLCNNGTEFLDQNGSCIVTCDAPFSSIIDKNMVKYCERPCLEESAFFYWNKSCKNTCDPPLVMENTTGQATCSLPCNGASEFLYWNQSCEVSCPELFIQRTDDSGVKYCELPCHNGTDFLYQNGSCLVSCETPFIPSLKENVLKYCKRPCLQSQFLYWNSSCKNSCEAPLIQNNFSGQPTCSKPCRNSSDFLYRNQTCLPSCPPPYIQTTDPILLCNLPCTSPNNFLYQNSSCLSSCAPPYTFQTLNPNLSFCNSPCLVGEFFSLEDSSCIQDCIPPLISRQIDPYFQTCRSPSPPDPSPSPSNTSTTSAAIQAITHVTSSVAAVTGVLNLQDPTSILILILSDLLMYIKYINVTYPSNVEELFDGDNQGLSISSLTGSHVTEIFPENSLPLYPVPSIYQKRGLYSSFLVNNWDQLALILLSLIAVAFFYPISKLAKKSSSQYLSRIIQKIRHILKWNLFLMFFLTNYTEITLFSALELYTFHFSTFWGLCSLLTCLVMISLAIFFLYKILQISKDLTKNKQSIHLHSPVNPLQTPQNQSHHEKWAAYQILYEAYKNHSMKTQAYLFFFTMRIVLCYLIVIAFTEFPTAQCLLTTLLSLSMMIYVILTRPMKETLHFIETIAFEIIVLLVNICVLALAILDRDGEGSWAHKDVLGEVIVLANLTVRILSAIFMVISLGKNLWSMCIKKRKPGDGIKRFFNGVFLGYRGRSSISPSDFTPRHSFRVKPEEKVESLGVFQRNTKRNKSNNPKELYMVTNLKSMEQYHILSTKNDIDHLIMSSHVERSSLLIAQRSSIETFIKPIAIFPNETTIEGMKSASQNVTINIATATADQSISSFSDVSSAASPHKFKKESFGDNEGNSPTFFQSMPRRDSLMNTFFRENTPVRTEQNLGNPRENQIDSLPMLQILKKRSSRDSIYSNRSSQQGNFLENSPVLSEQKSPIKLINLKEKSLLRQSLRGIRRSKKLKTIVEGPKVNSLEDVTPGSTGTENKEESFSSENLSQRTNNSPLMKRGSMSGGESPVENSSNPGSGWENGGERMEILQMKRKSLEFGRRSLFARSGQRRSVNINDFSSHIESYNLE